MENNLNGTLDQAMVMQQQVQPNVVPQPSDILSAISTPAEEEELSLDTLKKSEKEKILRSFKAGRDRAVKYYTENVEPKIIEREEIFEASPSMYERKFPRLSEQIKWRSMDVKTTVEWIMPSLLSAFTDGDDPIEIRGRGPKAEDDETATKLQHLIKYQLECKNSFYTFMATVLREAMKTNFGIAKCYWKHEEKNVPYEFLWDGNSLDAMTSIVTAAQNGEIANLSIEPLKDAPQYSVVRYDRVIVTESHPVVEYIPPSELRFTPEASNLQKSKFVAHRKIVTGDYLKRKEKEGLFKNVDKALENVGNTTRTKHELALNNQLQNDAGLDDNDKASKEVELYEAYLNVDYNNDGIMERLIIHAVGDTLLRVQTNEFEIVPFFTCYSAYDPCNVFSKESYADNLEQMQDLKTALIRQILISTAKNNAPQSLVDLDNVDADALLNGDEYVRVDTSTGRSISEVVMPIQQTPLSPIAMDMVNYIQSEIESQSGSTKYNQGLDSNSLNKTATGITAIMGAADKRIRMIARQMAEHFYNPLIKALILYNQKFLDPSVYARLGNDNLPISREELDIDYDLIISIGQGAGTKEAQIQYLMLMLNQLLPQWIQIGIADNKRAYNIAKELVEKLGMKHAETYLLDPMSEEGMQAQQQAQQQAQMVQQQEQMALDKKYQVDILKAIAPNLSIRYKDLPPEAKVIVLQAIGVNVDLNSVLAKELTNNETPSDPFAEEENISG